jgi:hypothetical protein
MRNTWRIGLVFVLAVMGNEVAAHAQQSGYFTRVTTPGVRRNAATAPLGFTRNVARSGRVTTVARTSSQPDSLRPYGTQALARIQGAAADVPRSSTWQQESQPVESPQVAPEPQARNYFPGMRPGLNVQRPLTLTAGSMGLPRTCTGGGTCTPSRSQMLGGGGHHR